MIFSNHHPSLFDIPPLKKPSGRCSPAAQSRATHPGEERVKFKSSGRPATAQRRRQACGDFCRAGAAGPGCTRHWPLFPRHSLAAERRCLQRGRPEDGAGKTDNTQGQPRVWPPCEAAEGRRVRGQEGFRQRGQRLNSQKSAASGRGRGAGSRPRGPRRQAACG